MEALKQLLEPKLWFELWSMISLSLMININSVTMQEHSFRVVKYDPFDSKLWEFQKTTKKKKKLQYYIYIYIKYFKRNRIIIMYYYWHLTLLYVAFNNLSSYCIIDKAVKKVNCALQKHVLLLSSFCLWWLYCIAQSIHKCLMSVVIIIALNW